MKENQPKTIPLVVFEPRNEQDRSMFPSLSRIGMKSLEVGASAFAENLRNMINLLEPIVNALPENCGNFAVDEFTFSLSVDAEGKVSLIAAVGVGVSSSMSIRLKRKPSEKK